MTVWLLPCENFGAVPRRHYDWKEDGGGVWILKKLPVQLFIDLDTSNEADWKAVIAKSAKKSNNLFSQNTQ